MSVSVDEGGGKGGKKSVNADLHLVPYIDLLTCLVSFLLITAVWTQLARLEARQKGQGQVTDEAPPVAPEKVQVVVNDEGFNLVTGQDQLPIPKKGTEYDYDRLTTELNKYKETHADKNDIQVMSEDQIKFEILVRTMDTALSARFPDISLLDAGNAGI